MKQSTPVRLATVLSSVLLAGTFVAYRAGEFNPFAETSGDPLVAESNSTHEPYLYDGTSKSYLIFPSTPQQGPEPAQRAAMMASSKSAVFAEPLVPAPAKRPPTVMAGSKSKAPLIDPSLGPQATQPSAPGQPSSPPQ